MEDASVCCAVAARAKTTMRAGQGYLRESRGSRREMSGGGGGGVTVEQTELFAGGRLSNVVGSGSLIAGALQSVNGRDEEAF